MTMDLKTPLYDCHVALEGRMVPFAGYVLPVQYRTGVIRRAHGRAAEPAACSTSATWARCSTQGPDALANAAEAAHQ